MLPPSPRQRTRENGYATFLAHASGTHVAGDRMGQGIIWPHVSVAELDDLDALMRHLNSDVLKLDAGLPPSPNTQQWADWFDRKAKMLAWKWDWTSYFIKWSQWRDDHYGEWARIGEEPRQQYDNWIASYNERLRSFKDEWGEDATDAETKKPAGKTAASSVSDLTDLIKLGLLGYFGFLIFKEVRNR